MFFLIYLSLILFFYRLSLLHKNFILVFTIKVLLKHAFFINFFKKKSKSKASHYSENLKYNTLDENFNPPSNKSYQPWLYWICFIVIVVCVLWLYFYISNWMQITSLEDFFAAFKSLDTNSSSNSNQISIFNLEKILNKEQKEIVDVINVVWNYILKNL